MNLNACFKLRPPRGQRPQSAPGDAQSRRVRSLAGLGLVLAGLGWLTSCNLQLTNAQPDQTRYFLLTAAENHAAPPAATPLKRWVVGVRTIDVAAYLRTKSFALRSRANEIAFLDFARWGEPLDQGLARVLAENLRSRPNVAQVTVQPFRADETRDFEVIVNVIACEGTTSGDVRFLATWRIRAGSGMGGPVAEGSYAASGLRWDGHDYGQLAARLSDAVAGLSREIGAALPKEPAQ